jgi:hypothetical protein
MGATMGEQMLETSIWQKPFEDISGEKAEKRDAGKFVKGVKEQDWSKSASLKLGLMTSLV